MKQISNGDSWWAVVECMAGLISSGYSEMELTEKHVRDVLISRGFTEFSVERATRWIERAINSGTACESLAMLQPCSQSLRIGNPLENVCFSTKILSKIEMCRQKGLISEEARERLLEGARVIDTRDWEDDEVTSLLAEMLFSYNPSLSEEDYTEMLKRCVPNFYC